NPPYLTQPILSASPCCSSRKRKHTPECRTIKNPRRSSGGWVNRCEGAAYELPPTALPTVVNVVLALVPRAVIAVMQTTTIRASITAYSTAVGPSSHFRKLTACLINACMEFSLKLG